jgi:hypothetical protein
MLKRLNEVKFLYCRHHHVINKLANILINRFIKLKNNIISLSKFVIMFLKLIKED